MSLILASQSPRRRQLLAQMGLTPRVVPANIPESPKNAESPDDYVTRLAQEKAHAVAATLSPHDNTFILAADTTVALGEVILEKPTDTTDALRILRALSGRLHTVYTAVALLEHPHNRLGVETVATRVRFAELDDDTIKRYIDTGEPMDKAGAYGIQGLAGAFVCAIEGSYTNVVGLPLYETLSLMRRMGAIPHFPLSVT